MCTRVTWCHIAEDILLHSLGNLRFSQWWLKNMTCSCVEVRWCSYKTYITPQNHSPEDSARHSHNEFVTLSNLPAVRQDSWCKNKCNYNASQECYYLISFLLRHICEVHILSLIFMLTPTPGSVLLLLLS
jgi:hypothetical protein